MAHASESMEPGIRLFTARPLVPLPIRTPNIRISVTEHASKREISMRLNDESVRHSNLAGILVVSHVRCERDGRVL